jgi:hypothetical protein
VYIECTEANVENEQDIFVTNKQTAMYRLPLYSKVHGRDIPAILREKM